MLRFWFLHIHYLSKKVDNMQALNGPLLYASSGLCYLVLARKQVCYLVIIHQF